MKLTALMPCRNEAWVVGLSLRAALRWCDDAVVLNHASTDGTAEILEQIQHETQRVTILNEPDPEWKEMGHRQRLLAAARSLGATHLAVVDADEVLTGNLIESSRPQIECLPPGSYLQVPMRNTYGSPFRYRSDSSIWGNSVTTLAFSDSPSLSWAPQNGYQHHQREPRNSRLGIRFYPQQLDGGVMHLQFASRRRLLAKHCFYQFHERIAYPDKPVSEIARLYSMAPNWDGAVLNPCPESWWEPYRDLLQYLDVDAEPWQEMECHRMVAQYGIERFDGLNLLGVL